MSPLLNHWISELLRTEGISTALQTQLPCWICINKGRLPSITFIHILNVSMYGEATKLGNLFQCLTTITAKNKNKNQQQNNNRTTTNTHTEKATTTKKTNIEMEFFCSILPIRIFVGFLIVRLTSCPVMEYHWGEVIPSHHVFIHISKIPTEPSLSQVYQSHLTQPLQKDAPMPVAQYRAWSNNIISFQSQKPELQLRLHQSWVEGKVSLPQAPDSSPVVLMQSKMLWSRKAWIDWSTGNSFAYKGISKFFARAEKLSIAHLNENLIILDTRHL